MGDRPVPEDVSPLARAAEWSSRIITISFEMVVPGLLGLWLDQKLGSKFVLAMLGFALGLYVGIRHLIQAVAVEDEGSQEP